MFPVSLVKQPHMTSVQRDFFSKGTMYLHCNSEYFLIYLLWNHSLTPTIIRRLGLAVVTVMGWNGMLPDSMFMFCVCVSVWCKTWRKHCSLQKFSSTYSFGVCLLSSIQPVVGGESDDYKTIFIPFLSLLFSLYDFGHGMTWQEVSCQTVLRVVDQGGCHRRGRYLS